MIERPRPGEVPPGIEMCGILKIRVRGKGEREVCS